jgi:hypothetical protein
VIAKLEAALADVEEHITKQEPKTVWQWADAATLRASAHANGTPAATLEQIVDEVRRGFENFEATYGEPTSWPETFGPKAQKSIRSIVRRLKSLESITVITANKEPIILERSEVPAQVVMGRTPSYREVSSVDGRLDLISVRGAPHFSIQEHGTNTRIRCTFPEEMFDKVKAALGQRVVVEGTVRYSRDGTPKAIANVRTLWVRPEQYRPVVDLMGSLPDLTQGVNAGEYVRRIRQGDEDGE